MALPVILGIVAAAAALLKCSPAPSTEEGEPEEKIKKDGGGDKIGDGGPVDEYIPPDQEPPREEERSNDGPRDTVPACTYQGGRSHIKCDSVVDSIINPKTNDINFLCGTPVQLGYFLEMSPDGNERAHLQDKIATPSGIPVSYRGMEYPHAIASFNSLQGSFFVTTNYEDGTRKALVDIGEISIKTPISSFSFKTRSPYPHYSDKKLFLTTRICSTFEPTSCVGGALLVYNMLKPEDAASIKPAQEITILPGHNPTDLLERNVKTTDEPAKVKVMERRLVKGKNGAKDEWKEVLVDKTLTLNNHRKYLYILQLGEKVPPGYQNFSLNSKPILTMVRMYEDWRIERNAVIWTKWINGVPNMDPVVEKSIELPSTYTPGNKKLVLSKNNDEIYILAEKGLTFIQSVDSERSTTKHFGYENSLQPNEIFRTIIWKEDINRYVLTTNMARHGVVDPANPQQIDFKPSNILTTNPSPKFAGPTTRPLSTDSIIEFSKCPNDTGCSASYNKLQ